MSERGKKKTNLPVTFIRGLSVFRGMQLEARRRCHTGAAPPAGSKSLHSGFTVSFFFLPPFFLSPFFRPHPRTLLLLLTLGGTDRLEEAQQPAPFCASGNPLDTPIGRRGGAKQGARNPNQKPYIEFVEFKNVPLKQNAAGPL